jgi:hypothetical protein
MKDLVGGGLGEGGLGAAREPPLPDYPHPDPAASSGRGKGQADSNPLGKTSWSDEFMLSFYLISRSYCKTSFCTICHSERSEESSLFHIPRPFATLRVTEKSGFAMTFSIVSQMYLTKILPPLRKVLVGAVRQPPLLWPPGLAELNPPLQKGDLGGFQVLIKIPPDPPLVKGV